MFKNTIQTHRNIELTLQKINLTTDLRTFIYIVIVIQKYIQMKIV